MPLVPNSLPLTVSKMDESQNLMTLLCTIAEDYARRGKQITFYIDEKLEGFVHRSITCNHCQKSPIRGSRYKCANCPDFDLCEECEVIEPHQKNHVFIKIRIPIPPLSNPRNTSIHVMYPGDEFYGPGVDYDISELQKLTHCKSKIIL